MSVKRDWTQRRYFLEASVTTTNGSHTTFIEHMAPGMTVPPHYHTLFSETFDLISGSMTVHQSTTADLATLQSQSQSLTIGTKVTITPGLYHQYIAGNEPTTLRVTLTPGHANFEKLLMILDGMADDEEFKAYNESPLLMAIVMELADAHLIGPTGEMLDGVRKEHGGEIEMLKGRLLGRFDNEVGLKKLMAL